MNKYKTIQIVCWVIVFLVFIGLALWFATGRDIGFRQGITINNISGPYNQVGSYSVSANNVDRMEINWISGGITITPYDGSEIKITEYAQRELKEDEILLYKVDGSKLSVSFCEDKGIRINMPSKILEILVPATIANNFEVLYIKNVSSDIYISDITAQYFELGNVSGDNEISSVNSKEMILKTTSGSIILLNSESTELSLKSVSGKISVNTVDTKNLSASTTSGDISCETVATNDIILKTVSGKVKYDGSFENMTANSASGSVEILNKEVPKAFEIRTISGYVNMILPIIDDFKLEYHSISGKFSCDFPIINTGNREDFYIKTTSGNINIDALQ